MYKVLIADDETINFQLFEKLLDWNKKGFENAGFAADGQEALNKYEEVRPDLIFMDIQMPFMDGLECVRYIRESDKRVKIVIISAYGDFSYAQRAIRYGVQDFLLKPVSRLMLNQLVDRMKMELDRQTSDKIENYFSNEWVEYIRTLYNNEKITDVTQDTKKLAIVGMVFLDSKGKIKGEENIREVVEKAVGTIEVKNGFLGCITQLEGKTILLWDEEYFEIEKIEDLYKYLKHFGNIYLYPFHGENTNLRQWIKEFVTKENYGFYNEDGGIYKLEEYPFVNAELDAERAYKDIIEAIATNSVGLILNAVEKIFNEAKQRKISPQILKDTIINFLVQIKFLMKKFEQHESFMLMRNIKLEDINGINSVVGLEDFLKNKIEITFKSIDEYFYQPNSRIVFRTNAFAELHYQDSSFSVQAVSDYLGLSKNYFTSLYKEQSGMGFWEYITEMRMEKAKELLLTTDYKIRDVAMMVGYESEYHFSRKFKEYFGKSPNEFRKNRSK